MKPGMLSVDEALATLLAGARPVTETEQVSTLDACGRVLAHVQHSSLNVPSTSRRISSFARSGRAKAKRLASEIA